MKKEVLSFLSRKFKKHIMVGGIAVFYDRRYSVHIYTESCCYVLFDNIELEEYRGELDRAGLIELKARLKY